MLSHMLRAIAYIILKIFLRPFIFLKVKGSVPKGRKVFAVNHTSYIDSFIFILSLSIKEAFYLIFMVKDKYTSKIEQISKKLGMFSVGVNTMYSLKMIDRLLKRNYSLLIFPEGTRSNNGVRAFRKTFVSIADEANATIVPVTIHKKGLKFEVEFLESVMPEDNANYQAEEVRCSIIENLESKI